MKTDHEYTYKDGSRMNPDVPRHQETWGQWFQRGMARMDRDWGEVIEDVKLPIVGTLIAFTAASAHLVGNCLAQRDLRAKELIRDEILDVRRQILSSAETSGDDSLTKHVAQLMADCDAVYPISSSSKFVVENHDCLLQVLEEVGIK